MSEFVIKPVVNIGNRKIFGSTALIEGDNCFQIVTETGFLGGLFTDDELSSQNIKDKEAKVAFLQKCIDATSKFTVFFVVIEVQ